MHARSDRIQFAFWSHKFISSEICGNANKQITFTFGNFDEYLSLICFAIYFDIIKCNILRIINWFVQN